MEINKLHTVHCGKVAFSVNSQQVDVCVANVGKRQAGKLLPSIYRLRGLFWIHECN